MPISQFPGPLAVPPLVLTASGPGGAPVNFVGPNVNHGVFWSVPDVDIGDCYWEFMAKTSDVSITGYAISDGSGGAHAMLIGFQAATGGAVIGGDLCKGLVNPALSFTTQSCDLIQQDEWCDVSILVNIALNLCVVHINGIASCVSQWGVGTRKTATTDNSGGQLFVFGSDHLNLRGSIAWIAGWDTNNDAQGDIFAALNAYRFPFRPEAIRGSSAADFVGDYTKQAGLVPDLSFGQIPPKTGNAARGGPSHPGALAFGGRLYPEQDDALNVLPTWKLDSTCPMYLPGPRVTANAKMGATQAIPADGKTYLLWEDFSNRRSTFMETEEPTLGAVPQGTLAPLTWLYRPFNEQGGRETYTYGVCWGYGISMGVGGVMSPAYLDAGTATIGVQYKKPAGSLGGSLSFYQTGGAVVFRMSNLSNMWAAITIAADVMVLRKYVAGVATDSANIAMGTWDSLRATAVGNVITVYSGHTVSGVTTWTQIHQVTDSFNNTATKVGLSAAGGSFARFENWGAFVP